METTYTELNGYPQTVITVYEKDDVFIVAKTLEFISKLLCVRLDYYADFDEKEIFVDVTDYYEFKTLSKKLYDHCPVA